MMKTIKVKKKLNLHELIAYVSVSGIKDANFVSNYENIVSADHSGQITTVGKFYNDTFTVEVEEEVTEDTVFDSLIEITADGGYIDHGYNISVSDVKGQRSIRFYTLTNKKLQLIWEAE